MGEVQRPNSLGLAEIGMNMIAQHGLSRCANFTQACSQSLAFRICCLYAAHLDAANIVQGSAHWDGNCICEDECRHSEVPVSSIVGSWP
jgi:hypothetical protein